MLRELEEELEEEKEEEYRQTRAHSPQFARKGLHLEIIIWKDQEILVRVILDELDHGGKMHDEILIPTC